MILWTIQPEKVYQSILENGVYRCDFSRSPMKDWKAQYDWLAAQMTKRLGKPPAGVSYPVWAWYQWEGVRKKPIYAENAGATVGRETDLPAWRLMCPTMKPFFLILILGQ